MVEKETSQPIILEAREFITEVNNRLENEPGYDRSQYGHAAANLVNILFVNTFYETPEEAERMQREALIRKAQRLLKEFGPEIIEYLTRELKLIIDQEKLLEEMPPLE
ncbi:MAG TPA: hypothetical protein VF209_03895 [Patescibacteria group bacterium]